MKSSLKQRKTIARLHAQDWTAKDIAAEVGLSIWTVRKWIGRIKKKKDWLSI